MQHRLNSACKGPATNRTAEVFYSLGENFSVSEAKVLIKATKNQKIRITFAGTDHNPDSLQ